MKEKLFNESVSKVMTVYFVIGETEWTSEICTETLSPHTGSEMFGVDTLKDHGFGKVNILEEVQVFRQFVDYAYLKCEFKS